MTIILTRVGGETRTFSTIKEAQTFAILHGVVIGTRWLRTARCLGVATYYAIRLLGADRAASIAIRVAYGILRLRINGGPWFRLEPATIPTARAL